MDKRKHTTIDLTGVSDTDKGALIITRGDTREVITYSGVESPIIDFKTNKVIKPGKLLNVRRNV